MPTAGAANNGPGPASRRIFPPRFRSAVGRYLTEAGESVAERYFTALEATLQQLARHPGLGRRRKFDHRLLEGIRSYRVNPPFHKHLIFYRHNDSTLFAERVVHGARDLPRRLIQPPGAEDE